MRVGLVACAAARHEGPLPATELYDTPLFRARRAHVEVRCEEWFVLTPRYGVVEPDALVEAETRRLVDLPAEDRSAWGPAVADALAELVGPLTGVTVEIHAGEAFCASGLTERLAELGAAVQRPVKGLGQGRQLAWYRAQKETAKSG